MRDFPSQEFRMRKGKWRRGKLCKEMVKLLIGDNKWRESENVCKVCGERMESLATHILTQCQDQKVRQLAGEVVNWRGISGENVRLSGPEARRGWTKEVLMETGERERKIVRVLQEWEFQGEGEKDYSGGKGYDCQRGHPNGGI